MKRLVLCALLHVLSFRRANSSRVRGSFERRRNDRRLFDPYIPTNILSDFTTEALGRKSKKSEKSKKEKCPKGLGSDPAIAKAAQGASAPPSSYSQLPPPKVGAGPQQDDAFCDEPGPTYSSPESPVNPTGSSEPGPPSYPNPAQGPSGPGSGGYNPPSLDPNTGGQPPGVPVTSIPIPLPTPSPILSYGQEPTQAPALPNSIPWGTNAPYPAPFPGAQPNGLPTAFPQVPAPTYPTLAPAGLPSGSSSPVPQYSPSASPAINNNPDHLPTLMPGDGNTTIDCNAIASGTASTNYDVANFAVKFILVISEEKEAVLNRLENFLQTIMAPLLAGCPIVSSGRRLDLAEIQNVVFKVHEDAASCTTNIESAVCIQATADTDVYYEGSDTSKLEGDLLLLVIHQCPKIRELEGIVQTFNPCKTIEVIQNATDASGAGGAGAAAVQGGTSEEAGVKPIGFVSLGVGILVVIMLIFLFARRSARDAGALKHQELDDFEDDTYLKELDANSESSGWRAARVVGEDDSVGSGSKGAYDFSGDLPGLNGKAGIGQQLSTQDVHVCSSATCDVCERRRQLGLQFVPTGMSIHTSTSLPTNAQRQYYARDTVDL